MRSLGIDIGGTSVKVALRDGALTNTARSEQYRCPDRASLIDALRGAIGLIDSSIDSSVPLGLCLPGRLNESETAIERSLNLPCLEGWLFDDLLRSVLGFRPACFRVVSDMCATTHEIVRSQGLEGRVAVLAIGTGVGLGVYEHGQMCSIGSRGIGHIGQIDVGRIGEADVVGRDGSLNTLESYVGLPALRSRLGGANEEELLRFMGSLPSEDPALRALVHAMRVVHAIYVPDAIVLAGGVGLALQPSGEAIRDRVNEGLTSLANPNWSLGFADSLYHAASGAAMLAFD